MALFIMILRKYYLRMRGLWGPRGFAKDAGKCSLPVCEKKIHFRAVIDEINTNKVIWIQCRPTAMNLISLGMKPSMI